MSSCEKNGNSNDCGLIGPNYVITLLFILFAQSESRCPPMLSTEKRIIQIFASRQITRTDQEFLMTVFARGKISAADEALINKIYDALNSGRLKVVD